MTTRNDIERVLWKACDSFRGKIDSSRYKDYILSMLFVKYLSDVTKEKRAHYMEQYVGWSFEGIISSITGFGMYVELENGIEGLVRLSDMNDDYYIFNESNFSLKGEHTAKEYHIGNCVCITVTGANRLSGQIDFELS